MRGHGLAARVKEARKHEAVLGARDRERQVLGVVVGRANSGSGGQHAAGQELLLKAERLLSADERQLVDLRKEGLGWDAIALKVGGSAEALRKKLARAVDRIAHRLDLDDFRHE